jgi:transcriptional regulator with XRE-family HTH domain
MRPVERNVDTSKTSLNTKELRKRAGAWLKTQRRNAGLSQIDLATGLGLRYYTFISQVENGFGRVPSESMQLWARCLGIPASVFARNLLAYYDPHLYRLLFEEDAS